MNAEAFLLLAESFVFIPLKPGENIRLVLGVELEKLILVTKINWI